jgi:predicted RNA-binding Zn-ribbon protein involved in translation (DUF1610 family)
VRETHLDHRCPHCGRANDTSSSREDAVPKHGDVSICWGCGGVAIFEDGPFGMSSRLPTDEELANVMRDPQVQAILSAIGLYRTPLEALGAVPPGESS